MCKMISSESIIGNFLLAALEKGDDRINVDKLFMFESLLGSNLNHLNYFTCLNYMNILDFAEDYPFFVKSVNEINVCMTDSYDQYVLSNKLSRYFKMGLPKVVINEMQTVSQKCWRIEFEGKKYKRCYTWLHTFGRTVLENN